MMWDKYGVAPIGSLVHILELVMDKRNNESSFQSDERKFKVHFYSTGKFLGMEANVRENEYS